MTAGRGSSYLVAQSLGLGWMIVAPASALWAWPSALRRAVLSAGLFDVATDVHYWGLLLAPAALVPLWMGARRYRGRLPLVLGSVGVAALMAHRILDTVAPSNPAWKISAWAGAALLLAALALNAVALGRWSSRRRRAAKLALAAS